jgi:alpha-N-arabinofuranosidase
VLDLQMASETYAVRAADARGSYARNMDVPFVDTVATYDAGKKQVAVFALNRDLQNERELALTFEDVTPSRVLACETVTGKDLKAFNTFENPNQVVAQKLDAGTAGGKMTVKLPPRSYTVVHLAVCTQGVLP